MIPTHYTLFVDETNIKLLSCYDIEDASHIECLDVFSFETNIYSEFLNIGNTLARQDIVVNIMKTVFKLNCDHITVSFKMNNIKSQLAFIDSDMDDVEIDKCCDQEASRFLISPSNYVLYRERLSKKIIRPHHLYWLAYIPIQYFNRIELMFLPIQKRNISFTTSHKDLLHLLPKTNSPIMLIEIQEQYVIVSKVQSHQYYSIKHFKVSDPLDVVYFISLELENELEKFPIYITGNGANKNISKDISLACRRHIDLLPVPNKLIIPESENFHNLSPAIGSLLVAKKSQALAMT